MHASLSCCCLSSCQSVSSPSFARVPAVSSSQLRPYLVHVVSVFDRGTLQEDGNFHTARTGTSAEEEEEEGRRREEEKEGGF